MNHEIERKFLVKEIPALNEPIYYERYYIFKDSFSEIRVQKKGDNFEFERKISKNKLTSEKTKFSISKQEFEFFKAKSFGSILRESYLISNNPEITIKKYFGKHQGLVRVEVEFENEEKAKDFKPLNWFGEEITDSPLGKDSKLLELSISEFNSLLDTN